MDISKMLSDPNFLQYLGQAGATLGAGGSVGEALNPSGLMRQDSVQSNNSVLLKQLLEGRLKPTPKGQEGPDEVTTKTTSDGTVTTIKAPSTESLKQQGAVLPLENQVSQSQQQEVQGGQGNLSPFLQALLGKGVY